MVNNYLTLTAMPYTIVYPRGIWSCEVLIDSKKRHIRHETSRVGGRLIIVQPPTLLQFSSAYKYYRVVHLKLSVDRSETGTDLPAQ
jgi:hypothetical protein